MDGTTHLISQSSLFTSFFKGKKALNADFERVAIPHLSHVYTAALYLTQNEQDAEDLVQETYLRAYRFFHKFDPGTNCRAWLLSIQRHLFINRYRQRKKQPEFVDWEKVDRDYESLVQTQKNSDKCDPEAVLCSRSRGSVIETALKNLPEEFRTAVVLVDIDELTYDEAAQIMECPVGTVRSRLSRGRRMLQVALKDYVSNRNANKT